MNKLWSTQMMENEAVLQNKLTHHMLKLKKSTLVLVKTKAMQVHTYFKRPRSTHAKHKVVVIFGDRGWESKTSHLCGVLIFTKKIHDFTILKLI